MKLTKLQPHNISSLYNIYLFAKLQLLMELLLPVMRRRPKRHIATAISFHREQFLLAVTVVGHRNI